MKQNYPVTKSGKLKLTLVLLTIIGVILVLVVTSRYGAGLSPDSIGYISAARNLIAGAGFVSYDGVPLVVQPPLYPIVLAFVGVLFNKDPFVIASIVNAVIFGFIVFLGGAVINRYVTSIPVFAFIGSLTTFSSFPLFMVSTMAWSEPLFILFVLLSLFFARSFLEKKTTISVILFSLFVALSALTRYIGVVEILWGALLIIFFYKNHFKNKIAYLALFLFISTLPIGIWLLRNYAVSNTFVGPRAASVFTLSQNIRAVFGDFIIWYFPGLVAHHRPYLIIPGLVIGLIIGLSPKDSLKSVKVLLRSIGPIILFIIIYLTFLIVSATTTAFDSISDRLLSPIYVQFTMFLLLLVFALVEPLQKHFSNKVLNPILIIIFTVWLLAYPVRNTIVNAEKISSFGNGYSGKTWTESETVQYLQKDKQFASKCTIYTNGPDVAYFAADMKTKKSPSKTEYNSNQVVNELSRLISVWPEENNSTCLVWFNNINRQYLFTIKEIQGIANLNLIHQFDDGAIYSVTRK